MRWCVDEGRPYLIILHNERTLVILGIKRYCYDDNDKPFWAYDYWERKSVTKNKRWANGWTTEDEQWRWTKILDEGTWETLLIIAKAANHIPMKQCGLREPYCDYSIDHCRDTTTMEGFDRFRKRMNHWRMVWKREKCWWKKDMIQSNQLRQKWERAFMEWKWFHPHNE